MQAWFEAMKKGRAVVSSGPLRIQCGRRASGDTVSLPAGGGEVTLRGWLRSVTDLESLALVCNGQEVERIEFSRNTQRYDLETQLQIERSGWCHLRAEGAPGDRFPMDVAYTQAFTNPVWFQVGDEPIRNPESASYGLRWIDRLQELADSWPGWRSEREKPMSISNSMRRGMCIGLILISKFSTAAAQQAETCTRHGDSNHGVQVIEERVWRIVQRTDSQSGAVKRPLLSGN